MLTARIKLSLLVVGFAGFTTAVMPLHDSRVIAQSPDLRVETVSSPPGAAPQRLSVDQLPSRTHGVGVAPNSAMYTLEFLDPATIVPSKPNEIGVVRSVALHSDDLARRFSLSDGAKLKIFAIKSLGARSMRVHFERFSLAPGDQVFVYGTDPDSYVAGPYQSRGPFGNGAFWSDTIDGDTVVIEARLSSAETELYVSEILHNYLPLVSSGLEPALLSCHIDASCFNDPERNAIARILFVQGGSGFVCTGQLINNRTGDLSPYFLTAAHCVSQPFVAQTVEAFWFYRTTSCNSGVLGSWVRTPAGSSLLNTNQVSDSSLLRVYAPLPGGVAFSGWDTTQRTIGTAVFGLHHPGGFLPPSLDSHLRRSSGTIASVTTPCPPSGLVNGYVADWTSGQAEPGSSGSGLWTTIGGSNYLTGVLSCGPVPSSCADFGLYGRFSDFYPLIQTYADQGDSGGNCAPAPVLLEQTVTGTLAETDCRSRVRGINMFTDRYAFGGVAGQQIAILASHTDLYQLNTYLYLLAPDRSVLAENDDFTVGSTNSRIPATGLITLPSTGTYVIELTSAGPSGIGQYSLQVTASAAPRILTFNSINPASGVGVSYIPEAGAGVTPFSKAWAHGRFVSATAAVVGGLNNFQKWLLDGADYTTSQTATVVMDNDHTLTAVYVAPPPCGAAPIEYNASFAGELSASDCQSPTRGRSYLADLYTFQALPGDQVVIDISPFYHSAHVYLLDSAGNIVGEADSGSAGNRARIPAGTGRLTLVPGGNYTIEVTTSDPGESGVYGVSFSSADNDRDGLPDDIEFSEGRSPAVKDNDIFGSARLFAMQQYRDFLGREGDASGITFWTNQINSGTQTRSQVIDSFFNSAEFQNTTAPVTRLYFAYFLRIPDTGGLFFWANAFKSGTSLNSISAAFASSVEFQNRYGSLDNTQFVTLVYNNVLGRAPDSGGLAFWVGQLDSGAMTRGRVMLGFSESAEYKTKSFNKVFVVQIYVGMLRRSADQGGFAFWVGQLDSGASGLNLIQGFLSSTEYRNRFLPPV